jgi:hypothetical protein
MCDNQTTAEKNMNLLRQIKRDTADLKSDIQTIKGELILITTYIKFNKEKAKNPEKTYWEYFSGY